MMNGHESFKSSPSRIPRNQDRCPSRCAAVGQFDLHRALDVRRKIASGYYDRPEVIRETARRILETGDIDE